MKVVVIDGQGGKLGQLIVESIRKEIPVCSLMAVGTNTAATAAMLKAGADHAATGENPVVVACRGADVIIGPIGILAADSLYGEITPKMALAVGQSEALKLLWPVSHCNNQVIGVKPMNMTDMAREMIEKLKTLL